MVSAFSSVLARALISVWIAAEREVGEQLADGVGVTVLGQRLVSPHRTRADTVNAGRVVRLLPKNPVGGICCRRDYFRTLIARAMTSARVDTATRDCTAIIALARRVSGIVSVGENAITLVKLT